MTVTAQQDDDDIRTLERRRYEAMLAGDAGSLSLMFADEVIYTHSNAARDSKATYIDKIATGCIDYLAIDSDTDHVTVIGDTAVTTGQMRAQVVTDGRPARLDTSTLSVWVRRDGVWQLLAD